MSSHAGVVHDARLYRPSDTSWHPEGKCREEDDTLFYHPDGERGLARSSRVEAAKAICATCPVTAKCLEDARARREPHGTWGGESEDERRNLLRRQDRARLKAEKEAAEREAAELAAQSSAPAAKPRRGIADGTPCARCTTPMTTRRPGRRTADKLPTGGVYHRARGLCDFCYRAVGANGRLMPGTGETAPRTFEARWDITGDGEDMKLAELTAEACNGLLQALARTHRVQLLLPPQRMSWRIDPVAMQLVATGPAQAIGRGAVAA